MGIPDWRKPAGWSSSPGCHMSQNGFPDFKARMYSSHVPRTHRRTLPIGHADTAESHHCELCRSAPDRSQRCLKWVVIIIVYVISSIEVAADCTASVGANADRPHQRQNTAIFSPSARLLAPTSPSMGLGTLHLRLNVARNLRFISVLYLGLLTMNASGLFPILRHLAAQSP